MTANTAITPFSFNAHDVRVIMQDGSPWFVAADICAALGVKNHRDSLMHLDDDEKGVVSTDTLGGMQQVSVVNESGLYALVLRSRKPEAKKFTKWVTSEVLPSIRKTGQYTRPHNPAIDYDRISPAQAQELKELVQAVVATGKQKYGETWARLQKKFRVNSYLELPADKFAEACDYLLGKLPEPQPLPRQDALWLQNALTASNAIASEVQAVAFAQLLSECNDWHNERWMLAFVEGRDGKLHPYAKQLPHDAIAMPVSKIARAIASFDLRPDTADLLALMNACTSQISQRMQASLPH